MFWIHHIWECFDCRFKSVFVTERFALYNSHASSAQEGSIHVAVHDTICKYYSAAVYHYVHFKYMYIFWFHLWKIHYSTNISYMAVNNRVFAVGLFYFCILNVAMQGFKFECITFVAKLIIGMPYNIFGWSSFIHL